MKHLRIRVMIIRMLAELAGLVVGGSRVMGRGSGWGPDAAAQKTNQNIKETSAGTTPPAITRPRSFMTPFGVLAPHSDLDVPICKKTKMTYPAVTAISPYLRSGGWV